MRFLILFILLITSNAEKSKKGPKKKNQKNDSKKVTEVKNVESTAPLPSFDVPRHTNDCKYSYHTLLECSRVHIVWYIQF